MQTRQGNMLQSLATVERFLDAHADRLAGVVKTGARTKLQQAIAELAAHREYQAEGGAAAKVATQVQGSLRRVLLDEHMALVSRVARAALPVVAQVPSLRMPRGTLSAALLAHAAYEMADAAALNADVFTEAGLPADFAVRMKRAADAMLSARTDHAESRSRTAGATQGLKAKLSAGRKIVQVLDVMVRTALGRESGLLTEWKRAKRVSKVRAGSAVPEPSVGAPIAA